MPTISTLTVDVEARTSKLKSGLKVAAAGFAALVAGAVVATDAASDLNESINKTGEIFGKNTPDIIKWGKVAAETLGLSQTEALDAASNMGLFAQSAGLSGTAVNDFAKQMVGLSGDLASFFNTKPAEAMEAIRAGLSGETEPLRKFGVFLTEAAIKQEALRIGLVKGNEELTEGQKILARQSLIMQQTGKAQGDFARTSDGLANSQRIASAEFENLQATIGQGLLPIFQLLVHGAMELITVLQANVAPALAATGEWFQKVWVQVGPLVTIIGKTLVEALKKMWASVQPLLPQLKKLWVSALPILKVLGALAGALLYVALKVLPITFAVLAKYISILLTVYTTVFKVVGGIITAFGKVVEFFRHLPSRLEAAGSHIWDWIVDAFKAAINAVIGLWNNLSFPGFTHTFDPLGRFGPAQTISIPGFDLPDIPTLAKGGSVMGTGLAIVHEGERFSGVGGNWGNVTVNVYGSVMTEHDLADTIQKTLLKQKRRSGALGLA